MPSPAIPLPSLTRLPLWWFNYKLSCDEKSHRCYHRNVRRRRCGRRYRIRPDSLWSESAVSLTSDVGIASLDEAGGLSSRLAESPVPTIVGDRGCVVGPYSEISRYHLLPFQVLHV